MLVLISNVYRFYQKLVCIVIIDCFQQYKHIHVLENTYLLSEEKQKFRKLLKFFTT